eukprot:9049524-Prorocentrum_lima.AAC.1
MAHLYEEGGNALHGTARYPIDQWMAAGKPAITVKHWVKLCVKIADESWQHNVCLHRYGCQASASLSGEA